MSDTTPTAGGAADEARKGLLGSVERASALPFAARAIEAGR